MENHAYFGSQPRCMRCFREKDHPIHQPKVTNYTTSPNENHPSAIVGTYDEKTEEFGKRVRTPEEIKERVEAQERAKVECLGHKCPKCDSPWKHDYPCQSNIMGLCKDCAQQSAALINRIENVKQIAAANLQHMTNQEAAQTRLSHEEFVVVHLIHAPDGSVREDWLERVTAHIEAKMRIIEELRIHISASYSARAMQQCEDLNKLTPEEREHYEKLAVRNKKPRAKKVNGADNSAATEKTSKDKAYANMLKDITKQLLAKNPNLSAEELAVKAEKKAKAMMEDD